MTLCMAGVVQVAMYTKRYTVLCECDLNCLFQAYLEFFASSEIVHSLLHVMPRYPSVNFHIINKNVSGFMHIV